MRTKKIIAMSALALVGTGLLGACELPGGETPEIPDLPPQICELLPPGVPGCELSAAT